MIEYITPEDVELVLGKQGIQTSPSTLERCAELIEEYGGENACAEDLALLVFHSYIAGRYDGTEDLSRSRADD